jgi:hypothetical protein
MLNVAIMSAEPLELDLVAKSYERLGHVELSESRVEVEWNDGWFWIDVESVSEDYFLEADKKELAKVYSAIGKPCLAELRHSDFVALDLAITNFPRQEGVFLDNGGLSIFSLGEIKKRIEHGVEWVDADGCPGGVDLILNAPDDDGFALVFLSDGALNKDQCRQELGRRLRLCLKDLASRRFRISRDDFSTVRKVVEIVCTHSLPEYLKQIEFLREELQNNVLPVQFLNEAEFRERHGFVPRDLPSLRKV